MFLYLALSLGACGYLMVVLGFMWSPPIRVTFPPLEAPYTEKE